MITSIDITTVFDTINRATLIEIQESFLLEYEIYIIRILLSNTTLDVMSSSKISNPFYTNVGFPQGEGLRGCLFTMYLEKAQRTLHDQVD